MVNLNFLEFDESRDFPYYNNNPQLSKTAWFILLLMLPVSFLLYSIVGLVSDFVGSIVFCFSLLIPLLYFSNWDYSLMFHKPTRNEIILAFLMFCGYLLYSITVGTVLDYFALSGATTSASLDYVNVDSFFGLIFSMMGEELVKFIPLMFFIRFIYKYSGNKRLSVIISSVIILIGFGFLHYLPPENTVISVLLLQGLGSVFEVYGYVKTKNLFVPYLSHFFTDALVFALVLLGFS